MSGDLDAAAYASLQAMLDGTSLDINDASEDALSSFPMIGPTGALRVLAYRSTRRPISNIEMLVDILGWSTEDADLLRPYLRFRTPRQTSTLRTRVQARVTTNGVGAENIRLLTRTRLRSSILEMALVTERDPQESSLTDHWAGYLAYRPGQDIEIFAGDLRPGIGLGLLYSRQSRSSVASAPSSPSRSSRLGTVATDENGALRGVGILKRAGWGQILALYARSRWDANLVNGVATLRLSGDHASEAGRAGAGRLGEETRLIRCQTGTNIRSIGLTLSQSIFSQILKVSEVKSRDHRHIGIDGVIPLGSGRLFAEAAISRASNPGKYGGSALIAGWRLSRRGLRLQVRMRRLSPNYVAIRSAPSAAYGSSNEWGLGLSAGVRSFRKRGIEAFIDRHGSLVRSANRAARRIGTRSRVVVDQRLWNFLSTDLRIATVQERSSKAEMADRFSRGIRLRLKIKSRPGRLSLWGERVHGWDGEPGAAHAFGGDLTLQPGPFRLDLWLTHSSRLGSAARIYAFRPEVWGGRSVLALPSKGFAASARISASPGPLRATLVYHAAPSRRLALQVGLTR